MLDITFYALDGKSEMVELSETFCQWLVQSEFYKIGRKDRSRERGDCAMDPRVQYRQWIQQVLKAHNQLVPSYGDLEQFTLFDREDDHYQIVTVGWEGDRRVFGCLIHIDIKGEMVWIQHDGTEVGVANELVALGMPKQNIVLGYQDPNARKLTEFAVG